MPSGFSIVDGLPVVDGCMRDFPADPVACMTDLQRRCGNLAGLREGDRQIILAIGPAYNHELLSRPDLFHSRFFALRGPRNSSHRRLTCGLLSMNGAEHTQQRRVVKGAFSRHAVSGYRDVVVELTDEFLRDWQIGQVRDLADDMPRLMLRITSSILFGMQRPELAFELGEMLHRWVSMNHELGMAAFLSEDEFYPKYEALLDYSQHVEARVREMIAQHRKSPTSADDVLAMLIQAHESGESISEDQLVGQTTLLFAAAHMTTAHSMLWTLFLLGQHPAVLRQLEPEIDSPSIAPNDASLSPTTSPLDCVIRESMRILPASAYSQRIAQQRVELGPASVPAGSVIVFSQYMTHRMESLYTNPRQFDPDRWLTIRPNSYEYLPFGGGPRLCIGAALATSIMRTILPLILRRFRLSALPQSEVSARVVSTMLGPVGSVPMRVQAPDSQLETAPLRGNLPELVEFPIEHVTSQPATRAA